MEVFSQSFASSPIAWPSGKSWALTGVVGSGNLEILVEQDTSAPGSVTFSVETPIPGYRDSWLAALEDFAMHYALGGTKVTIHDQGAPPIVIQLRLRQALDNLAQP